jgi:hypothetical protein
MIVAPPFSYFQTILDSCRSLLFRGVQNQMLIDANNESMVFGLELNCYVPLEL